MNNIPACNVCLLCQASRGQTDGPGDKNAYFSLWFVQKLAGGGMRLRHEPVPGAGKLPSFYVKSASATGTLRKDVLHI